MSDPRNLKEEKTRKRKKLSTPVKKKERKWNFP